MTKIYKLTIIMLVLILGPSACENCPDEPKYFSIVGLDIFNAKFTFQGLNPWGAIASDETVSWKNYFMRVGFQKTYYSQKETSAGAALYADCRSMGYLGSKIGVDTLYLVTINEYNDEFHQNDTLNNIVLTNDWTYDVEDFSQFESITSYIDLNRTGVLKDVFELKLAEPPSSDIGDYKFRLIFVLNNGEIFFKESNNVKLTR